jgi:hypothetical protein
LAFMLGIVRAPNVDPTMRLRAAQAAAPYCHAKPTTGAPTDPGTDAMLINGYRSADDATLVAQADRQSLLQTRAWLAESGDDPLTAEERAELAALDAKGKDLEAALPAHLKPVVDPADIELRALMADTPWGPTPDQARAHVDPEEERRNIKAKQAPIAEVKSTILAEPAEEGEVPPDPVDDDDATN